MTLPPLKLVVLDTETTGFVPRVHKIIEFASMSVENGEITKEYEQLFFAEEIPPHVEVLTHIKTADIQNSPKFDDRREEILALLPSGTLLVGQNLGFDLGMLKGHDIDVTQYPWIDTSMLASLVFPELESYSLGYLSTVLNLNHEPKHRALGDVRATLELLAACWERLCALPENEAKTIKEIMAKSSPGYQMLFEHLPVQKNDTPWWLTQGTKEESHVKEAASAIALPPDEKNGMFLIEEPLDPTHLERVIRAALEKPDTVHWVAVKNMDATLKRLSTETREDPRVGIVSYAQQLLDTESAESLLKQEVLTADEATLAVKIQWYKPKCRKDLPLHGGEEPVWNGKVACTRKSMTYAAQFQELPSVILIDHRQMLDIIADPEHVGWAKLDKDAHIIIDDASMLEDTATKAFGWECSIDDMRAAAEGNEVLTKLMDTFQLWIEKTRQFQDIRYLTPGDLQTPEAKGLRGLLAEVKDRDGFSQQVQYRLLCMERMIDPENLANRIAWIEQRQNGSQTLSSVPERITLLLQAYLYGHFHVSLIIPVGSAANMPEAIPTNLRPTLHNTKEEKMSDIPVSCDPSISVESILSNPPSGKTVLLIPSKGMIESLYVKYQDELEAKGVTMICQGMSGGQGRMQAEFHAAEGSAIWLLTCWTFEGIDLPAGTVDHLYLRSLPFDHPSHTVLSKRALHYRDPFNEYLFPRLLHRLFRVLRTYSRVRSTTGDVFILDERLQSKAYGKKACEYLHSFTKKVEPQDQPAPVKSVAKKPKKEKEPPSQPSLF
jgi:DNA polymerase III epsilon subunit-like protein